MQQNVNTTQIEEMTLNYAPIPQLKDNEKDYLETDVQEMEVKQPLKLSLLIKHHIRMVTVQNSFNVSRTSCLQF